jgi:hypothetical protein
MPRGRSCTNSKGTAWWYVLIRHLNLLVTQYNIPEHSNAVRAVGTMPPPVFPALYPHSSNPGWNPHPVQGQPSVLLPGYQALPGPRPLILQPSLNTLKIGNANGYTANHLIHHQLREQLRNTAYAGQGGKVVVVSVQMVHMRAGQTKKQLIGVRTII